MRWEEIKKRYPDKYVMLANIKEDLPVIGGVVQSPDEFTASVFGIYEEGEFERSDEDWFALANAGIPFGCERTTPDFIIWTPLPVDESELKDIIE